PICDRAARHVLQRQPDLLELVPQELNSVAVTQDVDDVVPLALLHKPLRYVGGSDAVPVDDREQALLSPLSNRGLNPAGLDLKRFMANETVFDPVTLALVLEQQPATGEVGDLRVVDSPDAGHPLQLVVGDRLISS